MYTYSCSGILENKGAGEFKPGGRLKHINHPYIKNLKKHNDTIVNTPILT